MSTSKGRSQSFAQEPATSATDRDGDIHVTRSILPSPEAYAKYLEEIFSSRHLTNEGRFAVQLEQELAQAFDVPFISLCTNGTLSLQLALRLKGLQGKEIITTPFTYVATVSALLWENCIPVFADIDEETLCLSPKAVESAMTKETAGILPVHIYGNCCDVEAFQNLGKNYGVPVIYDAAQAVGCRYKGKNVTTFGDAAICSFHATKVFHTVEGGAVITHSKEDHWQLSLLRAFGHRGDAHFGLGINAKLSELHAAMGLALLPEIQNNIDARRRVSALYEEYFPIRGIRRPRLADGLEYNYSYFPVFFDDPARMQRVIKKMNEERIFPRRYFSPALNTLDYIQKRFSCPVAEAAAERALCLPLYAELEDKDVERIMRIVKTTL